MYPYLFENWVGQWALIPTYAVCLSLAFTLAYLDALRRSFSEGREAKETEYFFLVTVLSSLAGARLFHVVFENRAYYLANPENALALWEGGLTFYGGLFCTLAALAFYCHIKKISLRATLDLLTPPVFIGLFVGRLGCLAAGCCWGKASNLPWAVTYQHPHTLSKLRFVTTHPSQLYEALGCLCIYFCLVIFFHRKTKPGNIFFTGLFAYAAVRFFVEFTRGDSYRGFFLGTPWSLAQFFSILLILTSCVGFLLNKQMAFVNTSSSKL
jgi:phosphatidylglycerol:prolipoprotein diacylglycerol transferase